MLPDFYAGEVSNGYRGEFSNMSEVMEIATAEVTRVKMGAIHHHPENPRYHSRTQIEELARSLKDHGYASISLTVSRSTGNIVKGNGMYDALTLLDCQEVDVVYVDMTPLQELQFLIRDNRLSELSRWDMPVLNANLATLGDEDIPLEDMGFELEAIGELTSEYEKGEADNRVIEEDEPPEVDEGETTTQTGDLWHLGSHRVLCGDSTSAEDVERVMGGEKADMVFTDPPYGVGYEYEGTKDDPALYPEFANTIYSTIQSLDAPTLITVGYKWNNLWFKFEPDGFLIWYDKTKQSPSGFAHLLKCELMLIFGKFPERFKWDIIEIQQPRGDGLRELHSCPKPMELYADILSQQYQLKNIVDPFLGSGTTLIAADQLDRVCYGLEIAPKYCDVIVQRYINHVGSSEDVWVERNGKKLTWDQRNLGKTPKVI